MTGGPPTSRQLACSVLGRLQKGLESLYRVETRLEVESFLISEGDRRDLGVARAPREQLLFSQGRDQDEVRIGLFLDRGVVSNLEKNDPARGLDESNFADFCLAVEGVSHFVYLALCAAGDRSVSALELELQAEVDKFACCLLVGRGGRGLGGGRVADGANDNAADDPDARALRTRLYEDISFSTDLDRDEHDRYRVANQEARRYTQTLSRTFVAQDRLSDMLPELRRFYRLGLGAKLGHIARTAA